MAWEFRKSGPGENVAVETSDDPFAGPKWAPPVWHMPEGLVMIVGLLRAVLAVIKFVVQNAVPVSVAVFGAWLGWRFGWERLGVLVLVLLVSLLVWFVLDRESFVRWLARPVRARWRLVFLYRRDWEAVISTAGLSKVHKRREYLPSIRKVRCGPNSDRVLVQMLKGQAPSAWEKVAENLAHGFGAQFALVRKGDKPGRVWLEFVRKDALKDPIAALPIEDDPDRVDLRAVPIGRQENGKPWLLRLQGTHVLIVGATGSGKGSILWGIVRGLMAPMRAGLVEIWAIDPKRMELSFGRALFERYGRYSSDPRGGMVALLEEAASDMNARAEQFAGKTRSFTPNRQYPFRVVIVDELAFLTAYSNEREFKKRAESALAVLTTQGRSVGYCVVGAQQDARKEVNTLRNLFPDRIALRLDEDEQVDMVLGDGARDRGALADQISSDPREGAGVGFVRLEASPDPVRVRAAFVSDDDIDAMVATVLPFPAVLDLDQEAA
jgi:S-DNA-T family DNA segregation ATPase FtsK/SpoIIIE